MLAFLWPELEGFDLFVIEATLVLAAVILSLLAPKLLDRTFRRAEGAFARFARRPVATLLVIALAPVLLRACLQPMLGTPQPFFHDEYSYLLNGDTFAHGRLTNPTHPLWPFFETFHEIQQPTYASQYPPGQGLFLALGEVAAHRPWIGVVLSMSLLCAALLWMLRGWFPPEWALLGALIAVIRLGLFSYWMNSYWGGAVAALGGAMLAGALPRLWKRGWARDGLIFGLGAALLANTRPYEGLLFSLPFVAALLWRRPPARALLTAGAILIATLLTAGYYNWRVTGDAWLLPHALKNRQYSVAADFVFQSQRPEPVYRHAVMRDFYAREELTYQSIPHSAWEFLKDLASRESASFWFFLGPVLALPFLFTNPRRLFEGWMAIPTAGLLLLIAGLSLLTWPLMPHYHAPATCALYAALILSLRVMRKRTLGARPFGLLLSRAVPCICVLLVLVRVFAGPLGIDQTSYPLNWASYNLGNFDRARVEADLNASPGRSLVIVRYGLRHNPEDEWVFNGADIDHQRIVWAREMEQGNQTLLDYFHDRQIYLLEPDVDGTVLKPYLAQ